MSTVFKAAPFFFIQVAMGTEKELESLLSREDWVNHVLDCFRNDSRLREAVLLASPSLYDCLKKSPQDNPETLARSLLRYLVRMHSRPTPFGYFSFVTNGTWDSKTSTDLEISHLKKRPRPDMEWLFALVEKLYQDRNAFSCLPVQANPLVLSEGGHFILNYLFRNEDEKESLKTISIGETPLIKVILHETVRPIPVGELWEKLLVKNPRLVREKTEELLQVLLKQQLLVPALRPSLLTPSPFNEVCSYPFATSEMKSIEQLICEYEKIEIGKGERHLQDLKCTMESRLTLKNVIQADAYSLCTQRVGAAIARELEAALEILWKLSPALNPPSFLEEYREKFHEAYGSSRTVPLLELFSETRGIGPFKPCIQIPKSKLAERWNAWLFQEWQRTIRLEKEEIVLTNEIVERLLLESKEPLPLPETAIPSLDVFCRVFAKSSEAIDQGEFEILYSQSNWQGGAAVGRFLDLLGVEAQANYRRYFEMEERLEPNTIFAELSYWPFVIRNANVAIQPCLRKHRLDLEERKKTLGSFSFEDIYVGVTNNRFYLTLKEGKKELVFRCGNFLNPEFAPEPIKFCRDVSLFRNQRVSAFRWGSLEKQAIFLPRVRFQKTILSPAQWNLTLSELENLHADLITAFNQWAKQWRLTDRFYLMQADQPLLFLLDHPGTAQEIVRLIKKEKGLRLIESNGSAWMQSSRGFHHSECIISFLKTTSSEATFTPHPFEAVPFEERWKLQGSEWIYVNFYTNEAFLQDFLMGSLVPFADHISQMEGFMGWFFVRYSFPSTHIRFRFRFSSTPPPSSLLALLKEAAAFWMKEGYIQRHELANYQREVERYGGLEGIDLAEEFFCADSLSIVLLLKSPVLKNPDISFYALIILCFLKTLGLNHEEMLACLGEEQDRALLEGYREHKRRLNSLIDALESGSENREVDILKEASVIRNPATECFCQLINTRPERLEIYKSVLHMHCNRLGCDTLTEQRARLFAKQGLQHYLLQVKLLTTA